MGSHEGGRASPGSSISTIHIWAINYSFTHDTFNILTLFRPVGRISVDCWRPLWHLFLDFGVSPAQSPTTPAHSKLDFPISIACH
jgi:hypothetical protein